MPQNGALSQAWKSDLGENWEHVHNQYLHTLGNLTLTRYKMRLFACPILAR